MFNDWTTEALRQRAEMLATRIREAFNDWDRAYLSQILAELEQREEVRCA